MKRLLIVLALATSAGQLTHAAGNPQTVDPASNATKPAVRLHIRSPFAASGWLTLLVKITPDVANRTLRITLDSGAFYRASDIQIDGAGAPRSHFVTWKALPPGDYCVEATLIRASGAVRTDRGRYSALGVSANGDTDDRPRGPCFTQFDLTNPIQLASTRPGTPMSRWEAP
ncbi:MAG: hypothetical protein QF681_10615 [Vicinamibacterales bacterium]|jgi:hypothetical protein|nr:hypothetical protein [Vicinamibacterales bacterium]